jgi:hypothetical protein
MLSPHTGVACLHTDKLWPARESSFLFLLSRDLTRRPRDLGPCVVDRTSHAATASARISLLRHAVPRALTMLGVRSALLQLELTLRSLLQVPGKEFTRTCKGLVVVLIGGYVLLQLLPESLNYLAIIPSK